MYKPKLAASGRDDEAVDRAKIASTTLSGLIAYEMVPSVVVGLILPT
jgi:hypothetical protein